jgi:hypothetical protein
MSKVEGKLEQRHQMPMCIPKGCHMYKDIERHSHLFCALRHPSVNRR